MIEIQSLTKYFGKFTALDNVSLSCEMGECVALIGPNGCGKTTLIKSILGMVIPDNGNIFFDKKSIKNDDIYRKRIGYMPQIGRYPDNMTISQVINMMKDIRKDSSKLDEELIETLGVNQLLDKRMHTLSGGTRQKVSAILSFLFNPDVLILDEPTSGLDPLATEVLKNKVVAEINKGKLIIITSHIISDLEDMVSHLIFMHEGNILLKNTPSELKAKANHTKLSNAISYIMRTKNII